MKFYMIKEEYLDKFNCTAETLIPETDIEMLARGWEISTDEVLEQLDEAENRTVWIVRLADAFDDTYEAFDTIEEATDKAKDYLEHLTESEREKNTVSIERYTIPCRVSDSTRKAVSYALEYDFMPIDPESYEEA